MPHILEKNSIDNWYPEERLFLFYLDAIWGNQSKDFQIISVIKHEISEALKKPAEEFLPDSIKINLTSVLKNAKTEKEKFQLKQTIFKNTQKFKKMKIDNLADELKEFLSEEAFILYKKEIDRELLNA